MLVKYGSDLQGLIIFKRKYMCNNVTIICIPIIVIKLNQHKY